MIVALPPHRRARHGARAMQHYLRKCWMTCRGLLQPQRPARLPLSSVACSEPSGPGRHRSVQRAPVFGQLLSNRAGLPGGAAYKGRPHSLALKALRTSTPAGVPTWTPSKGRHIRKRPPVKPSAAAMPAEKRPASEALSADAGPASAARHQQHPRKKPRRSSKSSSPDALLMAEVRQAARHNDPLAGLAAYDKARHAGIQLNTSTMDILLYLCSGGRKWDTQLAGSSGAAGGEAAAGDASMAADRGSTEAAVKAEGSDGSAAPASSKDGETTRASLSPQDTKPGEAGGANGRGSSTGRDGPQQRNAAASLSEEDWAGIAQRGRAIWQELEERGSANSEVAFTALGRMEAMARRPEGALEAARRTLAAGHPAKLRIFTPALRAFCAEGDHAKAFEVKGLMSEHDVDLTEEEFALLVGVCAHGAPWAQAWALLGSMSLELTSLQEGTLAAVERYFRSEAAREALPEGHTQWALERCTVSEEGRPSCCSGQLQALDLSEAEYEAFGSGIAALAAQRERKPRDFEAFQGFLERNGPYGCIVDGANAALFGQNFEEGGFSFGQIDAVVAQLQQERPDLKPLVLLHQSRVQAGPARQPEAAAFLGRLRKDKALYTAPFGSNDDWYWIYAAVQAGPKALVATCDEMRDHLFQLLRPKYFKRWKQRHQVYYKFKGDGTAVLTHPAPFTVCTQSLPEAGAWLFPAARSDEWLCAKPQGIHPLTDLT